MITNIQNLTTVQIKKELQSSFIQPLFVKFPSLKSYASIAIIGSLAYGLYDNHSDIDISIILPNKILKKYKNKLKEFKFALKQTNTQIQLFYSTSFEDIESLLDWQDDIKIREYSKALILHDPTNKFKRIQKQLTWYPNEVAKEKIQWLFAETVFELSDRMQIALQRKDKYFYETSKLKTLQLIMTIALLLNKQYPIYTKHLYRLQETLKSIPSNYSNLLAKAVNECKSTTNFQIIHQLRRIIESSLITKKYITKESDEYWINHRAKYSVKLSKL